MQQAIFRDENRVFYNPQLQRVDEISRAMGGFKKILMLEDDEVLKRTLSQSLYDHVFDVVCVGNAVEALKQIMEVDYDVIICDVMMPHLPGDMFYLAVQRVKPHLCSRF